LPYTDCAHREKRWAGKPCESRTWRFLIGINAQKACRVNNAVFSDNVVNNVNVIVRKKLSQLFLQAVGLHKCAVIIDIVMCKYADFHNITFPLVSANTVSDKAPAFFLPQI
jgi:hypothetical protein